MFILVIMLIPVLFFRVCKKCGKIDKGDEDYEKTRRRCKKYWAKEETGDLKDCKKRCKECKKCKKPDPSGMIGH